MLPSPLFSHSFSSCIVSQIIHTVCLQRRRKVLQAAISFPRKTYWICWLNGSIESEKIKIKTKQLLSTPIANALSQANTHTHARTLYPDDGYEIPENLFHLFIKHILTSFSRIFSISLAHKIPVKITHTHFHTKPEISRLENVFQNCFSAFISFCVCLFQSSDTTVISSI